MKKENWALYLFCLLYTSIPDEDNILVSAHSFNAYKPPLTSYTKAGARFLHIEGVYV